MFKKSGLYFFLLLVIVLNSCRNTTQNSDLTIQSNTEYFLDSLFTKNYTELPEIHRSKKFEEGVNKLLFDLTYFEHHPNEKIISIRNATDLENSLELCQINDWKIAEAIVLQQLGHFYWLKSEEKNKSFIYFNRANKIYSQFKTKQFQRKNKYLFQYANAYFGFEDYENAIKLMKEAIKDTVALRDYGYYLSALNSLSSAYRNLDQTDSSFYYCNMGFQKALEKEDHQWQRIFQLNKGIIYFINGNSEEAKNVLEYDLVHYKDKIDYLLLSSTHYYLGEIALAKNELAIAEKYLITARNYSKSAKDRNPQQLVKIFDALKRTISLQSNFKLALAYSDSTKIVNEQILKDFNKLALLRVQQNLDEEKYEIETNNKLLKSRYQRNFLIVIILLLVIIFLLIINKMQILYNRKKEKIKNEQERINIEAEKMKKELEIANEKLHDFMLNIEEKNQIIEHLNILEQDNTPANQKYEIISRLEKSILLTDDQWTEFIHLFEQVHGTFLQRLKDKTTGLSPTEIRIIVLSKLKISNIAMGSMLGVSAHAVRMAKHRLRKKLNLTDDAQFEKFVFEV